ncbi:MAG: hypothetical protein EHM58_04080 [Ignavibacteriae bacterium]|nr:MAG: hypothetical protein EHM58_04080 [Ignavibacteriota bacterium]
MSDLTNYRLIKYIIIILLIGIVLGSVSLIYPFGRDQGIYAYAGRQILDGNLQYKYVFDLKPPSVHFTFALGEIAVGTSMQSLRVFDLLWHCLTAIIIFLICFRLTKGHKSSLAAAVLYLFLYYRFDYWQSMQADSFMNLPFAVSILLLLIGTDKEKFIWIFLSGIFFGLTVFYKYTILGFLPLFFVLLYFCYRKNMTSVRIAVTYTLGFLIVVFSVIIVFFSGSALKEFLDVNLVQIPNYANIGLQTENVWYILSNLLKLFAYSIYSPLILLIAIHFFYLFKNKKFDFPNGLILIWVLCVLINLIIQWKFFKYHFNVLFPPLAIGAVLGFTTVKEKLMKHKYFVPVSLTLVILYCLTSFNIYSSYYSDLLDYITSKKTLIEIYEKKGVTDETEFFVIRESFKAVNYINSKTTKQDFVYIWGFDPVVYYLSGRECASRFIYNFPLYWKKDNAAFRRELITELKQRKPKIVLISKNDQLYLLSGYFEDSKQMVERFPELKQFVNDNYVFDHQTQNFDYYELNEIKQ